MLETGHHLRSQRRLRVIVDFVDLHRQECGQETLSWNERSHVVIHLSLHCDRRIESGVSLTTAHPVCLHGRYRQNCVVGTNLNTKLVLLGSSHSQQ